MARIEALSRRTDPAPWTSAATYSVGARSYAPSGELVSAYSAHTAGAVFDPTLWTPVSGQWSPELFGAVGDGVTDDTAAWQVCCDAAVARGLATSTVQYIRARPGARYLLNTITTQGVTRWAVKVTGDHLHIDATGATFVCTSTASNVFVFYFNAAGRTGGTNPMDYPNWCTRSTSYAITPQATRGVTVIPFQTAGHESNFAVNDWVLVRAGQTVPTLPTDQPDCELNQVTAVDTTAHTVTLRWPTSKPYQVEYVVAASGTYLTSTTVTAYGTTQPSIANVNNKIGRNVRWRGGRFLAPVNNSWVFFLHYYDCHVEDVHGTFDATMVGHQFCRRGSQRMIMGERTGTDASFTAIAAGVASGTNDVVIDGVWASGNLSAIHIHEGAVGTKVRNVHLACYPSSPTQEWGITLASRAYDYSIADAELRGGNANAALLVDQYTNGLGLISGLRVTSSGPAWSVQGSNVLLVGCDPGTSSTAVSAGSKVISRANALTADSTGKLAAQLLPTPLQALVTWANTFPGLGGNYIATPDSVANSPTADFELRVKVVSGTSMRPVNPGTFVSKYGASGSISYSFLVYTNGQLILYWSETGTTGTLKSAICPTALPATLTTDTWLRVQFSALGAGSAYTVKFATSTDKTTWTQLGTTITGGAVSSVYDSTTPVEIGSTNTGTGSLSTATLAEVDITKTIDGTATAHWQVTGPGATTYTAPTGETWTTYGSSMGYTASGTTPVLPDASTTAKGVVVYGTAAGTAAQGNDGRLADTRTPTDATVTDVKVAAAAAIAETKLALATDAAVGTGSRRTLGTGAQQAAAGDHAHNDKYVDFASDQSVGGNKTFTTGLVVPSPTVAGHPVRNDDGRLTSYPLSQNDRLLYGDLFASMPRLLATSAKTVVLGTIYASGGIAAPTGTATKLRMCSNAASAGTGSVIIAVYTGANSTTLTRVATVPTLTSVTATTVYEWTLSASIALTLGLYVYVEVLTTGFSTIPTFQSNVVVGTSALINPTTTQRYAVLSSATGKTALPATDDMSTGYTASGSAHWFALA